MNDNQKTALWLACLSFLAALGAARFIAESIEFWLSPIILIFTSIPLAGAIGILLRNKEILIASALLSLGLTLLGIMTVGGMFVASSVMLIASSFVYLNDSGKSDVDEKTKRAAEILVIASLFIAIAAAVAEVSWLYVKIASGKWILSDIEFIFLLSLPVVLAILALKGIREGNKEVLGASGSMSLVLAIFMGLFLQRLLFLASSALLIISAFAYRSGIIHEIKRETIDAGLKKTALVLAGASLMVAVIITLYSELVLTANGCYTYQTSATSGGTICSDFRPDYVIPVILSAVGIAGILRENKIMVHASAVVSFVRMIVYLSPVGVLFFPSFVLLIP